MFARHGPNGRKGRHGASLIDERVRRHREAIAAMNFFTVPTVTFGMLYCFFIISHDRRRILLFNVTILAEELNAEVTADEALRCYERRLKYSIEKKRAVGRKMARWFVPENSSRLMMRDFALRLSNWPITSYMVGQSFAGDSIF
jgi:hypothetical protein